MRTFSLFVNHIINSYMSDKKSTLFDAFIIVEGIGERLDA